MVQFDSDRSKPVDYDPIVDISDDEDLMGESSISSIQ